MSELILYFLFLLEIAPIHQSTPFFILFLTWTHPSPSFFDKLYLYLYLYILIMSNSHASTNYKLPDNLESTRVNTNNNNELDPAIGMTKVALDNADYNAAVELSTPAIHDFLNNIVNLLQMRAAAWAQKGRYGKALQDTQAIMTYAPLNPIGYLCTARRYAEQGFQVRAIDVLKKGLERVSKDDPQYETLWNEKQQAKERYAHRLDVFAYVPCDVVFRIIEFVPLETITQCTRVSSSWRGYIVDDPKFWQRIDVYSFTGEGVLSPYKLLPSISQHVKELSLPQGKQAKNCTELIRTMDFSNLRSLQVKRTGKHIQKLNDGKIKKEREEG